MVLLEEFSRRQFASTLKLEEDYAYKETISIAFDGYKKAMEDVDSAGTSKLANLLGNNVLSVLHERPGRLIEPDYDQTILFNRLLGSDNKLNPEEDGTESKLLIDLFQSAGKTLKKAWVKSAILIFIILVIGIFIGFYISSKNTSFNIDIQNVETQNDKPSTSLKISK